MEYNRIYQDLNHNDAAALNESIMDAGITSFPELEAAWNQATRFLEEQKLTFKQFQGTRTAVTKGKVWCDDFYPEVEEAQVLQYDEESFIIVKKPGFFHLMIAASEWFSNDLESLERILYDRWYI